MTCNQNCKQGRECNCIPTQEQMDEYDRVPEDYTLVALVSVCLIALMVIVSYVLEIAFAEGA